MTEENKGTPKESSQQTESKAEENGMLEGWVEWFKGIAAWFEAIINWFTGKSAAEEQQKPTEPSTETPETESEKPEGTKPESAPNTKEQEGTTQKEGLQEVKVDLTKYNASEQETVKDNLKKLRVLGRSFRGPVKVEHETGQEVSVDEKWRIIARGMIQCHPNKEDLTEDEREFNADSTNMGLTFNEGFWNQGDDETVAGVKIHIDEAVDLFDSAPQLTDEKTGCLVLGKEEFDKLYDNGKGIIPNAGVEIGDTGTCWVKAGNYYVLFYEYPDENGTNVGCDARQKNYFIQIGENAYFSMERADDGTSDSYVEEDDLGDDWVLLNKKMRYNEAPKLEDTQWGAQVDQAIGEHSESVSSDKQPQTKPLNQKEETSKQSHPQQTITPNQSTQTGGRE